MQLLELIVLDFKKYRTVNFFCIYFCILIGIHSYLEIPLLMNMSFFALMVILGSFVIFNMKYFVHAFFHFTRRGLTMSTKAKGFTSGLYPDHTDQNPFRKLCCQN